MIGRIRTYKPELLTHPLLRRLERELGWNLRLWYLGLWSFTDREGRFEWKPEELKHYIEPDVDVDFVLVLNVLANAGFVVKYRVGARVYGWVQRFLDHQQINGREQASRIPPPPSVAHQWFETSSLQASFNRCEARELLTEPLTLEHGINPFEISDLGDRSKSADASAVSSDPSATLHRSPHRTELNRTEQNRTEQEDLSSSKALDSERRAGLPVVADDARNVSALPAVRGTRTAAAIRDRMTTVFAEINEGSRTRLKKEQARKLLAEMVFLYWTVRFAHPNAILDPKREARIMKRLDENGENVSELFYALDGAFNDDQIMARGDHAGKKMYDGIETVLRDRGQVERFSNTRKAFVRGEPHKWLVKIEQAVRGENAAVFDGATMNSEETSNGRH